MTGDVLLTIGVENRGTVTLHDVEPSIVGTGFTSHDVTPIPVLEPGEIAEVFVAGNFAQAGDILLTVRIEGKRFYETVTVTSPTRQDLAAQKAADEAAIETMTEQVQSLIEEYDTLGEELYAKRNTHDISGVQLDDLRRYIYQAESALEEEQVQKANVSLMLANKEYQDQKNKLAKAEKKSFFRRIKDNIQVISAILGSIIATITLSGMAYSRYRNTKNAVKERRQKKENGEHEEQESKAREK
ncbi:TPA: hypothetical protein HA265_02730, partial [Candidatus Woesearchaeota archaeon]|nr:hypothetical protein [Candidatus Woesearchaeota archaeon]